eukprot:3585408-Rhodomonas_salina.3
MEADLSSCRSRTEHVQQTPRWLHEPGRAWPQVRTGQNMGMPRMIGGTVPSATTLSPSQHTRHVSSSAMLLSLLLAQPNRCNLAFDQHGTCDSNPQTNDGNRPVSLSRRSKQSGHLSVLVQTGKHKPEMALQTTQNYCFRAPISVQHTRESSINFHCFRHFTATLICFVPISPVL